MTQSNREAASGAASIDVVGVHEEELAAHAVDLFVTIEGSSLVTGDAALTKAKEVAVLVEALRGCGLADAAMEVVSVRAEVRSGFLGKSSSATYELKIRCAELEQLPALLGAITGAKNAELGRFVWRYPEDAETEGRLLAEAAKNGRIKAGAIAAALGAELGTLREARELTHHDHGDDVTTFGARPHEVMRARATDIELGVALQHHKKVKRELRLSYRVREAQA